MSNPPAGWRRPRGRRRDTWLRTVSRDVQPFSTGVRSAWRLAADRRQWRQVVDTAMLQYESANKEEKEDLHVIESFAKLVA